MDRFVLLLVLAVACTAKVTAGGEGAVLKDTKAASTISPPPNCPAPYYPIRDRCLIVDNQLVGTWDDARYMCETLGGHLVKLDDGNLMADIVDYICQNGLSDAHYWIGATDAAVEGTWLWHDGSPTRMGTPFWGDWTDQIQKPDGGVDHNCAYLEKNDHYFFNDWSCDETQAPFGVICEYD